MLRPPRLLCPLRSRRGGYLGRGRGEAGRRRRRRPPPKRPPRCASCFAVWVGCEFAIFFGTAWKAGALPARRRQQQIRLKKAAAARKRTNYYGEARPGSREDIEAAAPPAASSARATRLALGAALARGEEEGHRKAWTQALARRVRRLSGGCGLTQEAGWCHTMANICGSAQLPRCNNKGSSISANALRILEHTFFVLPAAAADRSLSNRLIACASNRHTWGRNGGERVGHQPKSSADGSYG